MSEVEFDHVACRYRLRPPPPSSTSSGGIATKRTMTGKGMNLDMNFDMMDTDEQSNDEDEKGSRQWEVQWYTPGGCLRVYSHQRQRRRTRMVVVDVHSDRNILIKLPSRSDTSIFATYSIQPWKMYSRVSRVAFLDMRRQFIPRVRNCHTKSIRSRTTRKGIGITRFYEEDLATWMGALRELNGMVTKVEEEARRQVEAAFEGWSDLWMTVRMEVLEKQGLSANTSIHKPDERRESIGNE